MEKKELSMIILGIVAVIAVVGLVLLFKSVMTGGAVKYYYPPAQTYSNVQADPWPYAKGTFKGGVMELPAYADGVQIRGEGIPVSEGRDVYTDLYGTKEGEGVYFPDWNRRRQPENTYVARKNVCDALSRLGKVPEGYSWDATYTMVEQGITVDKKCVKAPEDSPIPFCCTPPGANNPY